MQAIGAKQQADCMFREDGTIGISVVRRNWDESTFRIFMFGRHRASFYGTFLNVVQERDKLCAVLSPMEAIDYLAEPSPISYIEVVWSREAQAVRAMAAALRTVVRNKWYAPSLDKLRSGAPGFRLAAPDGWAESEPALRSRPLLEAAERWLNFALRELAKGDAELEGLFRRMQKPPVSAGFDTWDEQEWWEAIGFAVGEADALWRAMLRLTEPGLDEDAAGDGEWKLEWHAEPAGAEGGPGGGRESGSKSGRQGGPGGGREGGTGDGRGSGPKSGTAEEAAGKAAAYIERRRDKLTDRVAAAAPELVVAGRDGKRHVRGALNGGQAWTLLTETAVKLADAGVGLLAPAWWQELARWKPKLRASVRSLASAAEGESDFSLRRLVEFDWTLAVGDDTLTEEQLRSALTRRSPLVRVGKRWVHLDDRLIEYLRAMMKKAERGGMTVQEALRLYWEGRLDVVADGSGDGGEDGDGAFADASGGAGGREEGAVGYRPEVEWSGQLLEWVRQLEQTDRIPMLEAPDGFGGELRPYQQAGMSWLAFMRRYGLGCCLADDMGLGKTVQWIGYLLAVRRQEAGSVRQRPADGSQGNGGSRESGEGSEEGDGAPAALPPALLVCPTSVIGNWQKELERFAPSLSVYAHHGGSRRKGEAFIRATDGADVVLTSYALAHLDGDDLQEREWFALCLDEAQHIKNPHTKQATAIRRIPARHRIALTGTPVENRLTELWSIFEFLNPGYLGSLSGFQRTYARAAETGGEEAAWAAEALQRLVKPFLLRRLKRDPKIMLALPDKIESKTYVHLSTEAAAHYEQIVERALAEAEAKDGMQRKAHVLGMLTKLKRVCDHPVLVTGEAAEPLEADELAERSVKLNRLLEMLEEAFAEGDRCLVFTQYVEMGRLLQRCIARKFGWDGEEGGGGAGARAKASRSAANAGGAGGGGPGGKDAGSGRSMVRERVPFLYGGVPKSERDRIVETFQSSVGPGVLLLSLKAGGVGLNLTNAQHVFHYDRWWNPAVEEQATDRAYRIGQMRNVQVHKLITIGTLEERIDDLLERKRRLNETILGAGEQWVTELSAQDLRELVALRTAAWHSGRESGGAR